jgi:hypothetical protein
MAMEIQKGAHFIFYLGQGYMGSLEAYLAALIFTLRGVSLPALKTAPFLFFLLALLFHVLAADRIHGRAAAWFTLLFLAVPSWVFAVWTIAPRGGYMTLLALGGASLWLSALLARGKGSGHLWFLLGLAMGLGVWTHYLFAVYLLPLGLLVVLPALLRPGRGRVAGLLGSSFLLGVSPVIVYNVRKPLASLDLFGMASSPDYQANLFNLLARQLPKLLSGHDPTEGGTAAVLGGGILLLHLAAILCQGVALAKGAGGRGGRLLPALPLLVVLTGAALFLGTGFGAFNTQRYLLPLYPATAMVLAWCLSAIASRHGRLSAGLALGLTLVLAAGDYRHVRDRLLPEGEAFRAQVAEFLDYCRRHGVRDAWSDHWNAYLLTFLSRQELVVADTERERYEPFQRRVRESSRPALIVEARAREVGRTLEAAGYGFTRARVGDRTIFHDLSLRPEIGRITGRQEATILEEGSDRFTREGGTWRSSAPMRRGLSLVLTVPAVRPVNGLVLSPGGDRGGYPRQFRLETSLDGRTWDEAADVDGYLGGIAHLDGFRHRRDGLVSVHFPPRPARYLRLLLTGGDGERHLTLDHAWLTNGDGSVPPGGGGKSR